ncbi:MAG: peptidoglycan-binding protein [Coriobacteriia bacterium]|nr:peptidoglycan-binding protein [Coriobacteriia bacterium]
MARRYSVNAGHSAGSPGTRGGGRHEHIEARWATARMINQFVAWGNLAFNSTSDAGTASAVLTQQRDRARSHNAHFVISNHLNGFGNASARGVEVLYRGAAMRPLARAVSAAIARELGIPNRGAKQRTNLFFLNSFPSNSILIEWAFMTNAADMRAWATHRQRAVDAATRTIAANTGGRTAPAPVVSTTTPATPVAPAAFRLTSMLRRGSSGAAVRQLQTRLNQLGFRGANGRVLAVDGAFGPQTDHAVRAFQRNRRLSVDGIVGPNTARALGWTWAG